MPVPRVQHLIKRCKYEFLPHAPSALRSSCLTRPPFRDVPTEFENRFLCLLRIRLCTVKRVDFQAVLIFQVKASPRNYGQATRRCKALTNSVEPPSLFAQGAQGQTAGQCLSARTKFASANSIFSLAVCFDRPRYRVFRYRNCSFMTANTCSTLARTDDF